MSFGRAYQVLDVDVAFDVLWSRAPDCTQREGGKIGASLTMTTPGVLVVDYLHAISWI